MKSTNKKSSTMSRERGGFDAQAFLDSAGVAKKITEFKVAEVIYSQGDAAKSIMYLQAGAVKLSVVSESGKEAVVAILGRGRLLWRGLPGGSFRSHGHCQSSIACHSAPY